MPKCVKVADELEWLAGLRHDTERYYQDNLFTLELVWPETTRNGVARTVSENLRVIPPGASFDGMVIPSSDQDALYVRVCSTLKGPDEQHIRYLAHRLPLVDIPYILKAPILQGVLNRISWAFLKRIWPDIDVKKTHYELSRRHLSTLMRRANFRTLIRFVEELIKTEIAPCINGYFHYLEIFSQFTDQLLAVLITPEYPDELRELKTIPKRLLQ
jgi:hypothetical protein